MAANNDPIFINSPLHWTAELSNQIFPRAGGAVTTSPVLLGTAGNYGAIITTVYLEACGVVGANVCCLFTTKDSSAIAQKRCEVAISEIASVSNTVALSPIKFDLPDDEPFEGCLVNLLKLEPKESLYCALLQAEATSKFVIHAVGGDYEKT